MRSRPARLLAAALVSCARHAAAQTALPVEPAPAAPPEDKAAAQELLDAGRGLLDRGEVAEACATLARAVALYPRGVGGHLNLARCREREGKLATAWQTYLQAAEVARTAGRQDDERFAREAMMRVGLVVPRLTLDVTRVHGVPDLVIELDGKRYPRTDWTYANPVEPGSHEVRVSAPGKRTWSGVAVTRDDHTTYFKLPALADAPPVHRAAPPAVAPAARGCACRVAADGPTKPRDVAAGAVLLAVGALRRRRGGRALRWAEPRPRRAR